MAPAVVGNPNDLVAHASLVCLVKDAADMLERHYPGWGWMIRPDEGGGIIDIMALRVHSKYAYTLKIGRLQNDPTFRDVMRAGGEFLERFGFKAGPYTRDAWLRNPQRMGQFIPEVSDKDKQTQKRVNGAVVSQAVSTGYARITTDPRIGAALAQRAQGRL